MADQSMGPPETSIQPSGSLPGPIASSVPYSSTPAAPSPPPPAPQAGPSRPIPPPIDTVSSQHSSADASGSGNTRGKGAARGRISRAAVVSGTRVLPARSSTRNVTYNDDEQPIRRSTKLSLKVNGRGSSKNTSFLGEYDRELDDDPTEPLHFEEHFILRVPKEVAVGKGDGTGTGLRELAKGKGKGLEGIEFKFLGRHSLHTFTKAHRVRSSQSGLPVQRQELRFQAGRFAQHHRGAEDVRQKSLLQDSRHLPGQTYRKRKRSR